MADKTIKLYANQGVHVNSYKDPMIASNWNPITTTTFQTTGAIENIRGRYQVYVMAAFKFDNEAVKKKRIKAGDVVVYVTSISDDYPSSNTRLLFCGHTAIDVDFKNPKVPEEYGSFYNIFQDFDQHRIPTTGENIFSIYPVYDDWPQNILEMTIANGISVHPTISYGSEGYWQRITVATHLHPTRKPYLQVVYEDIIPEVTGLSPSGGLVYRREPVRFSWGFSFDRSSYNGLTLPADYIRQQSFVFRWRKVGEEQYTEITGGGDQFLVVPPNTFPLGGIEYQVMVTSDDGIDSEPTEWIALEVGDTLSTPVAVSPNGAIVDGSKPLEFVWKHIIYTGTPQTAFQLEYKPAKEDTWQLLRQESTDRQSYTLPGGKLPQGTVNWRVRTSNTQGEPGDWSNIATIIVKLAPTAPEISFVDGKPCPTVRWQSQGQQAFQVRFGGEDSGAQYGSAQEYTSPAIFPDGPLEAAVRVQNTMGIWSEWTTVSTTIQNQPGEPFPLKGEAFNHGVRLSWQGEYPEYQIVREDRLLGGTREKAFVDYETTGPHTYRVLAFSQEGYYTPSQPVQAGTTPPSGLLAEAGKWQWLPLKYRRKAQPSLQTTVRQEMSLRHYSGRTLPAAEKSGQYQVGHNLAFSLQRPEQVRQMLALSGCQVVYKDRMGRLIKGVLEEVSASWDTAADVELSITETSWEDENVLSKRAAAGFLPL